MIVRIIPSCRKNRNLTLIILTEKWGCIGPQNQNFHVWSGKLKQAPSCSPHFHSSWKVIALDSVSSPLDFCTRLRDAQESWLPKAPPRFWGSKRVSTYSLLRRGRNLSVRNPIKCLPAFHRLLVVKYSSLSQWLQSKQRYTLCLHQFDLGAGRQGHPTQTLQLRGKNPRRKKFQVMQMGKEWIECWYTHDMYLLTLGYLFTFLQFSAFYNFQSSFPHTTPTEPQKDSVRDTIKFFGSYISLSAHQEGTYPFQTLHLVTSCCQPWWDIYMEIVKSYKSWAFFHIHQKDQRRTCLPSPIHPPFATSLPKTQIWSRYSMDILS